MSNIKALRDRKAALLKEAEVLSAKAADGSITEDEEKRLDALLAEDGGDLAKVTSDIKREERLMEQRRSMEAVVDANDDTADEVAERIPAQPKKKQDDFSSFGEQLQAIARAGMNKGGDRDNRLVWQAAAGLNEAVPSEGGFLVQKQFSTELLDLMHDQSEILTRVRRIPISIGDGIKLPAIDESSRVDGSRWGGVLAYWANEADTVTASKPKFREMELGLKKLFGLGYATDELLRDGTALQSIMTQAFTEELVFKAEDAVINGTGSGQPLGILNSGAVISVAADSGQAAATVTTTNVLNMWARLPRRSRRNAVWLINQDIEPQLYPLTMVASTSALLYTPPGVNGNNSPYGLLMGRPVVPVEYCATLGTAGDIILTDLSQYLMIDKDGVQQAASMHVRFIYDEMTFRFIYRVDGQPAWNKAVTPYKGSNTQSPYITLATRS